MFRTLVVFWGCCILINVSACAQTPPTFDPGDDLATANLRGLGGVGVVVAEIEADLLKAGITDTQLRADTEQRLKTAGINVLTGKERLNSPGRPYVYVFVATQCDSQTDSCGVEAVKLMERVSLERNPSILTYASTWNRGEFVILPRERLAAVRRLVGVYLGQFTNASAVSRR
jgi:hypothetical protein